jgi:hypothetical protein
MFGRLFRKQRSLDELIFEIAEHHRDVDLDEFCTRMQSHLFYLPLVTPLSGPPGSTVVVGNEVRAKHTVMQGMKLVVFFTTDKHPNLGAAFAGIDGAEALRMTARAPELDGALFQNANASWVGLDKQRCRHVLEEIARSQRS